jgi:hypothetical protein
MKEIALLVGNGVNSISTGISWQELLNDLIVFCNCNEIRQDKNKPFPLFYEEIFLTAINNQRIKDELELKRFIAENVSKINANEIHGLIRQGKPRHIMTVNYEFLLEGHNLLSNVGLINERLYSIFRNYKVEDVTYWHLHGDCNHPVSINLGYEHYGGQLQKMRNYVTSIPDYKTEKIVKKSLIKRLHDERGLIEIQSWIDLFFTIDIHIIGLALDFVETDLWWLLTYRARAMQKKATVIGNKIYYYIPEKYANAASFKMDLLTANGVTVIKLNKNHDILYYKEILKRLFEDK